MPRKYARKPMKKRRGRKRAPRKNFKSRVLAIVNKNREMKRLFFQVDGNVIDPVDTQFLTFSYPAVTGYANNVISNRVLRLQGDSTSYSRDGNEITPRYWQWKGIVKYIGAATATNAEEVTVRMVLGFVDGDNAALQATDNQMQLSNGTNVPITDEYSAIMRKFNWKRFRPVQERVFKLSPAGYTNTATAQNTSTGFNIGAPISKLVTMKYYFGKDPKNIVYPNSGSVAANSGNLQLLIMSRYNNDYVGTSARTIKVVGEGFFSYFDC